MKNSKKTKLRREFLIPSNRKNRLQVLSSGGGTQSSCMIVLAHMGVIPKPDIVIISDTEYESSDVFPYQEKYLVPLCEEMGVDYIFVKKSDWTEADIKLSSTNDSVLPPFFNEMNGRSKNGNCAGKQPGFCSDKWKVVPIRRYLNNRYGKLNLDRRGVDFWIGMSFDEARRVKYPSGKWQKRYPLFESQILREQAIKIVEEYNLPTPPMSACWMCPNRHDDEWQAMKIHNPKDLKMAGEFEKKLQKEFPGLWLHSSGKPIETVDFVKSSKSSSQMDIFVKYCDTGLCFV